MAHKTQMVHISEIQNGDTIMINGEMATVGRENIKGGFMGRTIFGNPFIETGRMVEQVLFAKWFKGEIIGYRSQV